MKKWIFIGLAILGLITCIGCKTRIQYVPVESVKTEYRYDHVRDSIYLRDSVLIRERGDTVWLEKYTYLYRDKLVRDSIFLNDTIRIPYPVEVEKRVKYVSGWQNFQIWGFWILLAVVIGLAYWAFKRIKKVVS